MVLSSTARSAPSGHDRDERDGDADADPVAIDLNVDAALFLQHLIGMDSYPHVLALLPTIYNAADRDRVHAVLAETLADAGILVDGVVHPVVANWLRCLHRPDVELVVRIVDSDLDGQAEGMLRLSLVRCGDNHVLAVRCDDHVVVQPVFGRPGQLDVVAAALSSALGPCPALRFEPVTVAADQFAEAPSDPAELRRALVELGAVPHTATVLTRALGEVVRRAEVVMIEHRDGEDRRPEVCVSVFDTPSGRVVVVPRVAMDGRVWSTYAPGDEIEVGRSVRALVELLPGRDWFGTSRSG
ncbi:ESX secretion-associated protein EspG [Nocardia alni]|uniref:ESX secretion-associated protein EspG n=1 Tax=Nocardia alni TaxID=2815723 RepID=UPI001C233945|nr:ESX secretion-associated protein EspG [Nocardia alni]